MDDVHSGEHSNVPITFVLRIGAAEPELTGVVELVRTGEKHRFRGTEALASLVARMASLVRAAAAEGEPSPEGEPS